MVGDLEAIVLDIPLRHATWDVNVTFEEFGKCGFFVTDLQLTLDSSVEERTSELLACHEMVEIASG